MSKVKATICRFTVEQVNQSRNFYDHSKTTPDVEKREEQNLPKVGDVTQEDVKMRAVNADDIPYGYNTSEEEEVQSFADATPWGELQLVISNRNVTDKFFLTGLDYYVEIKRVPDDLQNQDALEYWKSKGKI